MTIDNLPALCRAFPCISRRTVLPVSAAILALAAASAGAQTIVDNAGSARNGKVGANSSLIAGAAEVAISYYCEQDVGGPTPVAQALRFAWKSGDCWQWTNVASGGSSPSMARDASGLYHIVFQGWNGLSWAYGYGNTWAVSGTRVDSGVSPSNASMALDSGGSPHVAYLESSADGGAALRYTEWNGAAWMRGPAEYVIGNIWTPTIGCSNTFLALDSSDVPHVVFVVPNDGVNAYGVVEYASLLNGAWSVETLGILGVDPTLRIGSDDVPQVTFRQGDTLVYASRAGGTWQAEAVSPSGVGLSDIGSVSLALDPVNAPCVAYESIDDESLYIATRSGGGWTGTRIDGGSGTSSGLIVGRFGIGVAIDPAGTVNTSYTALTIYSTADDLTDSFSDLRHFTSSIGGGLCPLSPGACCDPVSGICTLVLPADCGTGTTWNGAAACSPTLCAWTEPPTLGACCGGAICVSLTAAACSGPNTRFTGVGVACNPTSAGSTPCCRGDFDQDQVISLQDLFTYLSSWFEGDPHADIDGAGTNTLGDVFDFLTAWFAGC